MHNFFLQIFVFDLKKYSAPVQYQHRTCIVLMECKYIHYYSLNFIELFKLNTLFVFILINGLHIINNNTKIILGDIHVYIFTYLNIFNTVVKYV